MMSELDIFTKSADNLSVEKSLFSNYQPLSSLDGNGPIEFYIAGSSDYYLDLSQTLLQVKVKVLTSTGADLTTEVVAPVNNFFHSLFNKIDLQVQDKLIGDTNTTYPYKSYLETLLSYGQDAKQSQLSTELFYKESDTNVIKQFANPQSGTKKRQEKIVNSKSLEMLGHLHLDLFHSDRYLINNIPIKVRLHRSKPEFCLISTVDTKEFKVIFETAILFIKKVKVSPGIQLAHAKVMESGTTAKYPYTTTGVRYFSVAAGLTDVSRDNLFLGVLPSKLFICLTSTSAFDGTITQNPFQFQHYHLNHLAAVSDSETFPTKPFTPNFDLSHYTREYLSLFSTLHTQMRNEGNYLTYSDYLTGNTIFGIDLSADICRSSATLEPHKQGNLRIEMRFKNPLPENVTCLIYFEYNSLMEIDKSRNVLLDSTI